MARLLPAATLPGPLDLTPFDVAAASSQMTASFATVAEAGNGNGHTGGNGRGRGNGQRKGGPAYPWDTR